VGQHRLADGVPVRLMDGETTRRGE